MSSKGCEHSSDTDWAAQEFGENDFGDKRLTSRLIKIAEQFAEAPETSINEACEGWSETKSAYRFFQNDKVDASKIIAGHVSKTEKRVADHSIVLAIQDTSYFTWRMAKTKGLGIISRTPGRNVKKIESKGLVMHTCFAVTTEGLPVGILDQQIFARQPDSIELRAKKKRAHNVNVSIEEKESIRWLESLRNTVDNTSKSSSQIVTVCDREGDFYELLECAMKTEASVLVRARGDRRVNKTSRYKKDSGIQLLDLLSSAKTSGRLQVKVPQQNNRRLRVATVEVKYSPFKMNPPRNHIRHRTEKLLNLPLFAIYVIETNPPSGVERLEWMLITDIAINSFDDAVEKVRWYCFRWRIEVFHKILKSGLQVEKCRLGSADRLIKYLTVMSIVAWRIYWITLVSRTIPKPSMYNTSLRRRMASPAS